MDAIRLDVLRCAACGQVEQLRDEAHMDGSRTITIGCACGAAAPRVTTVPAGVSFVIGVIVEMQKEEQGDDDPDSSGV